jgi:hypothetical protein
MVVPILSVEDQPNNRVKITMGTQDFGQAIVIVPKESLADAGLVTVLDRLWDQQKNIQQHRKRSAKKR